MGAWPSKGRATPTSSPPAPRSWSGGLRRELAALVLRRVDSHADRVRFAAVCRRWRLVARQCSWLWSDLPPELAGHVLRRLASHGDRARFAAVCRGWRHVARQFSSRWSALSPELADLVLRRLPSHADRVRFAAVCRHWRHVATQYSPPLPPAHPWLNLGCSICRSLPDGEMHFLRSISMKHAVCLGSFDNWLLYAEVGGSRRCFLENPLSRTTIQLPGYCEEPIHAFYGRSPGTPSTSRSLIFHIHKLIVCSSDLIVAMISQYTWGQGVVVCCRPGMSLWSTSTGLFHGLYEYQDMAFHDGKIYTVDRTGRLFAHEVTKDKDTGEPRVSWMEQVIPAPPQFDDFYAYLKPLTYLVTSLNGTLLMVRWMVPYSFLTSEDSRKTTTLGVFEADFETRRWLDVESLDDQVLFVSSNCSKAIGASTHGEYLQGNKIYFVNDRDLNRHLGINWKTRTPRTCVYDMSSKSFYAMSSLGECMMSDPWDARWFFP
ncbi:hypothetical protein ACP70R_008178 [Stipagrostis hirtigluma subsp. patula]